MSSSALLTGVIVVAVLVLVVHRQLRPKALHAHPLRLPVILGVIGLYQTYDYLSAYPTVPLGEVAGVVVGLVLAGLIAYPRAQSMRVYQTADGTWMRKGNLRTLGWWVAAVGAHVAAAVGMPFLLGQGVSGMSGLEGPTLMIYLAVSLGLQFWFLHQRTLGAGSSPTSMSKTSGPRSTQSSDRLRPSRTTWSTHHRREVRYGSRR